MCYMGIRDASQPLFDFFVIAMWKEPDAVIAYLRQVIMIYFLRRDVAEYAPASGLGL